MAAAPAIFPQAAEASADARLKALYTAEWAWREQQFADDEASHKPILDHLPKVDAASQEARLATWTDVMQQLDGIGRGELSAMEQVNYDIYRHQIAVLIARQLFRNYEMPVNSDNSFWTAISYTATKRFKTPADYRKFIAKLRDVPRYFDEQIGQMRAGLGRGFTAPQVTLNGRDVSLTAVTEPKPEETPFYVPFKEMPPAVPAGEQASLRTEVITVIRDLVQPTYAKVLAFMRDEYLPGARQSLAAEALPDGKAWYRAQILEYTTRDLDPAEIHRIGLSEVAALHESMVAEMKAAGFDGDFPAFLHFLRTDPQFYPKTKDELLMRGAWIAKTFDGKAAQYFGRLPRERFTIKPVPDDMAPFYTAGRGGATYLLNTYNLSIRPLYNLTALTLHEADPGHALQLALAREHKDQPEFRKHTYISAYGEGWALYCERLGLEMGMYETAYDRFGMYGYQIWRAARLVVDTGMHSLGWTRGQAIQYLLENTALPRHEVETEVDRYISWPGQALSYYLGEMTILEGRAKAEAALGANFDIRAFHDCVLELGSVPLPILEARIDRFIAEGGKGPYPHEE